MLFQSHDEEACLKLCDKTRPEYLDYFGGPTNEDRAAWVLFCNLKSGLEDKKAELSATDFDVLKRSLFAQFQKLGVSTHLVMTILSSFRVLQEAAAEKALN